MSSQQNNNSSSSFTSDISRIVLLGIAFDVSRYFAREILGALSARRFGDNNNTEENNNNNGGADTHEDGLVKQYHTSNSKNKYHGDRGDQCSNPITSINDSIVTRLGLASVGILEQCKLYMISLKRQLYTATNNRRRFGLCLYFLLPPPLIIYGAWSSLVCKRNNKPHNNFGGMYVSSLITSLGLLFVYEMRPRGRRYDDNTTTNEKGGKMHENYKKEKDSSADSLTKLSTSPSAIFRPPLPPPNISEQLERRPRSDSLRSAMSESSVNTTPTINASIVEKDQKQKYLEILVHNVSHTDLVLGLSGDGALSSTQRRVDAIPFPAEFEDTPRKTNNTPNIQDDGNDEKYIICRPRFSAFDLFSRRVLSELQDQIKSTSSRELKIISYPRYERTTKTASYKLVTPRPSDQYVLPVGFNLERTEGINNTAVDPCEMPNLRVRGRDIPKVDPFLLGETPRRLNSSRQQQSSTTDMQTPCRGSMHETLRINAVFFPLLATLMPRWLGQISEKFRSDQDDAKKVSAAIESPNVKKVVVLVSGVGTPRNWTHSISGNSTQTCAELMELFINVLYPDITVVRCHSETNIFRYDENIAFATQELMPCIDSYRDAHARSQPYPDEIVDNKVASSSASEFNPDWRHSVSVTYSFADGSAARSHAIQAALRPYKPTYFHFWQLKTFWHSSKITDEDIEVHSFAEMETEPAMAVDQTSDTVMMVVNEMKAFRKEFVDTLKDGGRSDLKSFWLRKTKKPVLAVLLVQKPDGKHVLYRGTNMEVSMPTGSLCAERNVIGTALASDPGLKREDLIMVAVLSVQLPQEPKRFFAPPPGPPLCQPIMQARKENEDFAREVEDKIKQQQALGTMRRSTSRSSFASIAEAKTTENDSWEMDVFQPTSSSAGQEQYDGLSPLASPLLPAKEISMPATGGQLIPELNLSRPSESSPSGNISGNSTPKRRIKLYQKKSHSKMGGGVKRQKQSVLVESFEDMNPLKPCGACNEWLKKIAESNPHFKVLTFTDTNCNGVYEAAPSQD